MKKMIVVMMMLLFAVVVSGCNAVDGFFEDTAGTAQAIRQKVTTPMADKAKARDADVSAKAVSRYHAEQASRYAQFSNVKGQ